MGVHSWKVFCLVVFLLAIGCGNEGGSYVPCITDGDCDATAICDNGACHNAPSCKTDGDCQGDRKCIGGFCKLPECNQDTECPEKQHCQDYRCVLGECRVDADCNQGFHCDVYQCVADECTTDGDCAPGLTCEAGRCKERPKVPCTNDQECQQDELCLDGFCQIKPVCTTDPDCPQGTVCERGRCARPCNVDADCVDARYACQNGHCLQRCLGDPDCQAASTICEGNVCVPAQCQVDEQCTGTLVRCHNGRCETYTTCSTSQECDPNFECLNNICEELPLCYIDGDCLNEPTCQASPCICHDGHCHGVSSCSSEVDCDISEDCIGGLCVPHLCRGPADCETGFVCTGGACVPIGDPATVYQVVILTPGGPIRPNQQIQLEAIALTQNNAEIPGIVFEWNSSETTRASVDLNGLLTGGSQAGATLITAKAQGTTRVSDPVTFLNILDAASNTLRVTVVDAFNRTPVASASVLLVANQSSETGSTDTNGTVTFTQPTGVADVHVFTQSHDYVSVLQTISVDLLIPVVERSNRAKAGGFSGQMTFPVPGEVALGLAGTSIGGNLVDLNFSRLLGETFNVTVTFGAYTFDLSLPAQMVLGASYSGIPIPIKDTYYVAGQRGLRTVWGMGGMLDISVLMKLVSGSGSIEQVLIELLPYFSLFHHGLKPSFEVFPIPLVQDANDLDGDNDVSEMRPDWKVPGFPGGTLPDVDLAPSQRQDLALMVNPPNLPMYAGTPVRTVVFVAGALSSLGLTPLGLTSEEAVDGIAKPIRMKMAPAYGGLEIGQYAVLVLALPPGSNNQMPTDVAMVVYQDKNIPTDITFDSGFLEFPEDASYSEISRTLTASGIAGATLYRSTLQTPLGKWEVYLPAGGMTATYTLPNPPIGMDDLATGGMVTFDPIALSSGMTYEDLVSFNGDDLDQINRLAISCTRFQLP